MAATTFNRTDAGFPRARGFVANLINVLADAFTGTGRRDLRSFTPEEREDLGLTLADIESDWRLPPSSLS